MVEKKINYHNYSERSNGILYNTFLRQPITVLFSFYSHLDVLLFHDDAFILQLNIIGFRVRIGHSGVRYHRQYFQRLFFKAG